MSTPSSDLPLSSSPGPWASLVERLFPPLGDRHLARFYRHLATMLDAGVPIGRAIDTAGRGSGGGAGAAAVFRRISTMVGAGRPISAGMAAAPYVFRPLHIEMVRTGEETGHLPDVLKDLARWCDDRVAARRLFIEGMVRPALLLHALVLIPPAPALILGRISLAGYLVHVGLVLGPLYAIVLGALAAWRLGVTRPATRRAVLEAVHRVPVVGTAVWKLGVARMCRALRLLYLAGVELPRAVQIAGRASGDDVLAAAGQRAARAIEKGEPLTDALAQTGRFSHRVLTMIETAEVAGRLEVGLEKLDEYLADEARTTLRRSIRTVSFLIYLGVMLLVAIYIISFYMGHIQDLNNAANL